MSEEISREEIAALLARESMSKEITREQAIGVITMHREHWRRLLQGNVCSKVEGEESIASFDMAITALSSEPFKNTISRQYAIDTFNRWAEFKDYTHVERHILHAVVDELRAMPSISEQPAEGGNHDGME